MTSLPYLINGKKTKKLRSRYEGKRGRFMGAKGFSLIEMMVSVVVMSLLVGGGVAAYIKFNDKQQVVTTGKEFGIFVRAAQKKVKAGDKPESGCNKLEGYQLDIPSSAGPARIYAMCSGGVAIDVKQFDLTGDIEFKTTTQVNFKILSGGVDFGGSDPLRLILGDPADTYLYEIQITSHGSITDCGVNWGGIWGVPVRKLKV